MSAWIVSKAHIDMLVTATVMLGERTRAEADVTGQMLWDENYKSVNARYRRHDKAPAYRFKARTWANPSELLKALACYDYQTCEHDAWGADNAAYDLVEKLRVRVEPLREEADYEAAPWGIDEG